MSTIIQKAGIVLAAGAVLLNGCAVSIGSRPVYPTAFHAQPVSSYPPPNVLFINESDTATINAHIYAGYRAFEGPGGLAELIGIDHYIVRELPLDSIRLGSSNVRFGQGPTVKTRYLPDGVYTILYHAYSENIFDAFHELFGGRAKILRILSCSRDFGIHASRLTVDHRRPHDVLVRIDDRFTRTHRVAGSARFSMGGGIPTLTECYGPRIRIDLRLLNPIR